MKLMAAQGNWTRMEEAEHADPITQLSQIRNLDGSEMTTEEMMNRFMDWYNKPDGYERRFTNTDTDPVSMESYYPLECFHQTDQLRSGCGKPKNDGDLIGEIPRMCVMMRFGITP